MSEATATQSTQRPRRKRRLLRRIILWLLVLIILAVIGLSVYRKLRQEYTITYQPYTATTGTISNSLSFSGTLQAIDNTTYTAPSAVTVRAVYVTYGQDVQDGDALLRLSNGQTVEADFDGRVNQLPVAEGDKVSSGDTLAQVVDFNHMKVSFRVDEYDISDVQVGDACRITATATEAVFESTVADINYVSSSTGSVAYYTATAYVDVTGGVYPGMQVTVTIPQEEASNVVILKEDALSFDVTNQAYVYMQASDGQMTTVYIKTGVSNGNYVEIKEGLRSGDTVYAEVKETSSNTSLFGSLFTTTRINTTQQTRNSNSTRNSTQTWNQGGSTPGGTRP